MLRVMPQKTDVHDWGDPPKNWAEEQARRTALEIRRLRGKQSAQWLSDRTKELGSPITRAVISDLELGRRRYVTSAELIVLAAALDTAPIALLYPPPYNEIIELVPGVEHPKIGVVEWFCSDDYAARYQPSEGVGDFSDRTWPLYAARAVEKLEEAQRGLLASLANEADPDSPLARSMRRELDYIAERLKEYREEDGR
ncbi:hypothetical protein [Mycolicibacterium sp. SCSIO 43805]|uniref:hypothetical protein n=1 Tax=Mycolicibacterium sp. SCSIO 43805 TaxID=3378074 RepID=UPI003AB86226